MVKRVLDTVAGWVQSIDEGLANEAVLLNVTRTVQHDSHSCGAHAALAVLRCHGKGRSLQATMRALGTDAEGTSTSALLKLFRKRGLRPIIKAKATLRDLKNGVDDGAPSIVSVRDGAHWIVVFGYEDGGRIFIADSSIRGGLRVAVSRDRFMARWDRWAMTVSSSRSRR